MPARDIRMYREAHEAADVVARQFAANKAAIGALAHALRAQPPRFIVTCARGSSDHAAAHARYVFETQQWKRLQSRCLSLFAARRIEEHRG